MVDLSVSDTLQIQSHRGIYCAVFDQEALSQLNISLPKNAHFIIDAKVATLYKHELAHVLASSSTLLIHATEDNKSLDRFPVYVESLLKNGIRRGHTLIAIGGGIIQDITCFLASTLFRGLPWGFYPTTLLAQADSCIGSKSSVNVGKIKNILGTFTPPEQIFIDTNFLKTLDPRDIHSGIGEMLKVHAIDGPESFDQISADYQKMLDNQDIMQKYILQSLRIKKKLIEIDEFDQGLRNVMNYGHSFGHAIESATCFCIPHGIAVTIGMDMANYIAMSLGILDKQHYQRMHPVLRANYSGYETTVIPMDGLITALSKDKKNMDCKLRLILLDERSKVNIGFYENDANFQQFCFDYLSQERIKINALDGV